MSHASHERVREIARKVAAAPVGERREVLDRACEGDRVLRSRVEMMLLRQDNVQTIAELPESPPPEALATPGRIGHYAITRILGEGGMGVVYLAEQDRPRRTVALKVIRPGLLTPKMLRRFELESETLAKLQHPGIASIFEAATHESAYGPQPYFAMELVEGKPLTLYAFENKLDLEQRLELFRKVCDAVQHAHQKGVVHRDLKPSNILVTASGQPKILDFGIARATDNSAGPPGATLRTEAGTLVGTLPYMSPEQVHDPSSVDVRSDVYTLGVILFELLTGKLPHALDTQTLPEAVRIIAEAEAPSLRAIDRSMPSDVATITAKAMEKDRTRRYQSASDLGADIGRYLNNEPILARPPSRAYRIRKFVRRNRALVAGVSLAFLALVGGVIGTTWQAAEATRGRQLAEQRGKELEIQKQIAEREAATAKATNEFLNGMLAAASPESESSGELTVREVLDLAAARLASTEVQPRVEIPLRSTLSNTYRALGRTDDALREAKRCLDLARENMGENSVDELEARRTYAVILAENGESDEAEKLTRAAILVYEKDPAKYDRELAQARCELGRYLIDRGMAADGAEELRRGIEGLKKHVDFKDRNLQTAMHNYGAALDAAGRPQEAEKALREALAICEKQFGSDHAATAYELNTLANMLQRSGRNDEAIAIHQRTLAIRQKRLPPGHPSILTSMANLATCYVAVGRYDEAITSLRETIELQKKTLGPSHPKTLSSMNNLAFALEDTGKIEEAQATMRKVVELQRVNGFADPESWGQLNNLASLLVKLNRAAEAEKLYRELFAAAEGKLPADHIVRAIYRNNFGECLLVEGKLDEAKVELDESDRVIRAFFKPEHPRVKKSQDRIEKLVRASNEKAASTPASAAK
ncbi:MAG: serine/threonine protein kinase [Planctomycetes bacterium]|nr:serine/threonine protein kinase [Planctomycetota bacterium]